MEYLEKLRKLFNVQELAQKRIGQLEREGVLDQKLKASYYACPDLTFLYIMKIRELNRQLAQETYTIPGVDYPEKAEKNMAIIDSVSPPIDTPNMCQCLGVYISKIEKLTHVQS